MFSHAHTHTPSFQGKPNISWRVQRVVKNVISFSFLRRRVAPLLSDAELTDFLQSSKEKLKLLGCVGKVHQVRFLHMSHYIATFFFKVPQPNVSPLNHFTTIPRNVFLLSHLTPGSQLLRLPRCALLYRCCFTFASLRH